MKNWKHWFLKGFADIYVKIDFSNSLIWRSLFTELPGLKYMGACACVCIKKAQKKNFSSLDFKTKLILIGKIWKSFQPQSKNAYLFGVYILQEKKMCFFQVSQALTSICLLVKYWAMWISFKRLQGSFKSIKPISLMNSGRHLYASVCDFWQACLRHSISC